MKGRHALGGRRSPPAQRAESGMTRWSAPARYDRVGDGHAVGCAGAWRAPARGGRTAAAAEADTGFTRQFTAEWLALLFALAVSAR